MCTPDAAIHEKKPSNSAIDGYRSEAVAAELDMLSSTTRPSPALAMG
jgi:hypothetical protein